MVLAWALRLGLHIAGRAGRVGDDPRYAELRRQWGGAEGAKMFRMLQMQALASVPLALGIILAAHNPTPELGFQDAAALTVFAIGIGGGAVADGQLRAFAARTGGKGGICEDGLWAWSRHPNYFFECIVWASWPVMAIAGGYPFGYAAILAPACIAWLLLKVSGIPPLEEHMLRKHGDAYRAYRRRVGAFIPRPPRKIA
jgi:steroid 5-alpha reductase family enzyme